MPGCALRDNPKVGLKFRGHKKAPPTFVSGARGPQICRGPCGYPSSRRSVALRATFSRKERGEGTHWVDADKLFATRAARPLQTRAVQSMSASSTVAGKSTWRSSENASWFGAHRPFVPRLGGD